MKNGIPKNWSADARLSEEGIIKNNIIWRRKNGRV